MTDSEELGRGGRLEGGAAGEREAAAEAALLARARELA